MMRNTCPSVRNFNEFDSLILQTNPHINWLLLQIEMRKNRCSINTSNYESSTFLKELVRIPYLFWRESLESVRFYSFSRAYKVPRPHTIPNPQRNGSIVLSKLFSCIENDVQWLWDSSLVCLDLFKDHNERAFSGKYPNMGFGGKERTQFNRAFSNIWNILFSILTWDSLLIQVKIWWKWWFEDQHKFENI